jgi:hypothetical protein
MPLLSHDSSLFASSSSLIAFAIPQKSNPASAAIFLQLLFVFLSNLTYNLIVLF